MAYDALRMILPIAGWPEEKLGQVEISGGADPVLPTPFRIGAAGAAALAATGLAAAVPNIADAPDCSSVCCGATGEWAASTGSVVGIDPAASSMTISPIC